MDQRNYITILAMGENQPNLANALTEILFNCGCNILSCKINTLGDEFCFMGLLAGSWGTIAKLETLIPKIEQQLKLKTLVKRTAKESPETKYINYIMHAITVDKPGLLSDVTSFFANQNIQIENITTHTFNKNHGISMCDLELIIKIPEGYYIPTLRENFINYCDNINLDAGLEPFTGA